MLAETMKFDILILLWFFVSARSKSAEYYIASSTSCPMESCLTLSQFATNSSNHLDVNSSIVLLLQPGSHKLDLEIRFQTLDHVSLLSNGSDLNELSSVAIINCRWPARIAFGAVKEIHIRGLQFRGCYTHNFISASQLTIESCRFQNHTGSALDIMDSTMKVIGTSFISNSFGTFSYGYASPVFKNK